MPFVQCLEFVNVPDAGEHCLDNYVSRLLTSTCIRCIRSQQPNHGEVTDTCDLEKA